MHPKLRLDFYDELIMLTKFKEVGQVSHPVSAIELVNGLTKLPVSSGLLPPKTLFWQRRKGEERMGIMVEAQVWEVRVEKRTLTIPLPAFVFIGCGRSYNIHAIKNEPISEATSLYYFPAPNVHLYGGICQGNTSFPICQAGLMETAVQLFLTGSTFNQDLAQSKCRSYPQNVLKLWQELDKKMEFPIEELVETGRLMESML